MAVSAGPQDLYAALGVAREADAVVISAAYRALSKKYHPDTSAMPEYLAAAHFRVITEAHEVLSDARRRAEYDAQLDARAAPQAAPYQAQEPPWAPWTEPPPVGPEPKSSSQDGTSTNAWVGFAVLCALGIFAAVAWPSLRVPVILLLAGILAALLKFRPEEPDARRG
jgi:hypothetical protein